MNILALEFSTPRRSVAIFNQKVLGQASEQGTRETHAFKLIGDCLKQAHLGREQIECIAVGIGPGSYAGIRIAIAIAQGWSMAREVKLAAVSSADAVAAQAQERGCRGPLQTIIDAQRKEFFGATYELSESGFRMVSPFMLMPGPGSNTGIQQVRFDVLEHPLFECIVPEAATIARLAAQTTSFVDARELSPIYVRKAEFVKAAPARFKDVP